MIRNVVDPTPITSSFLSCEKDTETILRKLFVESNPYSKLLTQLLVVQNKDALDKDYDISKYTLKRLIDEKYILLSPKMEFDQFEDIRSFIVLNFDNFVPNTTNPLYRDCFIHIDVVCHNNAWDLGNYRARPFKIMGIIDGILNKARLSGIGQLNFAESHQTVLNQDWSYYNLTYLAIHGSDDLISSEE